MLCMPGPRSDEQASANEDTGGGSDANAVRGSLHLGKEVLLVGLRVSGPLAVSEVGEGTLSKIVELVSPAVSGGVSHSIVYPEGVLGTVSVLVVVNGPEAVAQQLRVHARVERILRHVEDVEARQDVAARVLLLGEVL